jgi:WD40 repeat protein
MYQRPIYPVWIHGNNWMEAVPMFPPKFSLPHQPRNPYKGLRAFQGKDFQDFFGRGHFTQQLIQSLHHLPYKYPGHTGHVYSVAWSPNGIYIASGSNDKTVQVWKADTADLFQTYMGHTDVVTSVAWSPDGTRIASGSSDKTIQVWKAIKYS